MLDIKKLLEISRSIEKTECKKEELLERVGIYLDTRRTCYDYCKIYKLTVSIYQKESLYSTQFFDFTREHYLQMLSFSNTVQCSYVYFDIFFVVKNQLKCFQYIVLSSKYDKFEHEIFWLQRQNASEMSLEVGEESAEYLKKLYNVESIEDLLRSARIELPDYFSFLSEYLKGTLIENILPNNHIVGIQFIDMPIETI